MASDLKRQTRTYSKVACQRCRHMRKKCNGGFPCTRCVHANTPCRVYSAATNEVVTYDVNEPAAGSGHVSTDVFALAAPATPGPAAHPAPSSTLEARVAALEKTLQSLASLGPNLAAVQSTLEALQGQVRALAVHRSLEERVSAPSALPAMGQHAHSQRVVPPARFGGTMEWAEGSFVMGTGMRLQHVDWRLSEQLFGCPVQEMLGTHISGGFLTRTPSLRAMWGSTTFVLGPQGLHLHVGRHEKCIINRSGALMVPELYAEGDWLYSGDMRYAVRLCGWVERVPLERADELPLYFTESAAVLAVLDKTLHKLRQAHRDADSRDVLVPPSEIMRAMDSIERPPEEEMFERVLFSEALRRVQLGLGGVPTCADLSLTSCHPGDVSSGDAVGEIPPVDSMPMAQGTAPMRAPLSPVDHVGSSEFAFATLESGLDAPGGPLPMTAMLSAPLGGDDPLVLESEYW